MRARYVALLGVVALGLVWSCGGLVPPQLEYDLHVMPVLPEGRGDYTIDPDDSSMVFSKEGLLIKIRHLSDPELNERFPPSVRRSPRQSLHPGRNRSRKGLYPPPVHGL